MLDRRDRWLGDPGRGNTATASLGPLDRGRSANWTGISQHLGFDIARTKAPLWTREAGGLLVWRVVCWKCSRDISWTGSVLPSAADWMGKMTDLVSYREIDKAVFQDRGSKLDQALDAVRMMVGACDAHLNGV